jgi:hypothetical protein
MNKRTINRHTVAFTIVLLYANCALAQRPVTLSVFNEATTLPFTTFFNLPVHPGAQVGTEFQWKESQHFKLYPTVNIGYMFHKNLFHGLYINAETGVDYKTNIGLNIKAKIGLGYMHTFSTQQEYQFKNGVFESKADGGNARLMSSITFGLGYTMNRENPRSPEIFALYQPWVEYPYSPGFIPLMSHTNLHFGAKFYPFENGINK